MGTPGLTTPLPVGSLKVAGRLYKSATGETRATHDGFVTDELLEFYEPMAIAGTPLIITGNAFITPDARGVVRELGADSDAKVPGLRELADMIHGHGSRIFAQINHCGRQAAKHAD